VIIERNKNKDESYKNLPMFFLEEISSDNAKRERIQDGKWGTEADSVSSVNQRPC
jgi:hypothetical protein